MKQKRGEHEIKQDCGNKEETGECPLACIKQKLYYKMNER
jgi:hypothetical protein